MFAAQYYQFASTIRTGSAAAATPGAKRTKAALDHAMRYGALRGIRTPDPQIRSLVLYPAELAARPQFRVLELTPEGIHQYGGGYTENVARTGHEAPGLHPG